MYPKITYKDKPGITPNSKAIGEKMTQPDQAISLKDLIEQSLNGFPTPMQREEIKLPEDVNQILQGVRYDIPSDAKFARMSKVERARLLNNTMGLKQQLSEKLQAEINRKQQLDAQISTQEGTPPPAQSA